MVIKFISMNLLSQLLVIDFELIFNNPLIRTKKIYSNLVKMI